MKITAITCTFGRPEALELCERYLRRQTRQPDQWLILDGPDPMPLKVLNAIKDGRVEGDVIAFWEDDDWFRPDWLEWAAGGIQRGYDVVGEGHACYYHVGHRWWSECRNVRHAALCQTVISRDMLEPLANVIQSFDSPFFDTRIWQVESNKFLALPKSGAENRVIGIKGMPSVAPGYSGEHRAVLPQGVHADPSLLQLFRWIGNDASAYLPFKR